MKKTKILSIIIAFLVSLVFMTNVYATDDEWTDFTNAKLIIKQEDSIGGWTYKLNIEGVTFNQDTNSNYIAIFSNSNNAPTIPTTLEELKNIKDSEIVNKNGEIQIGSGETIKKYYEKNDDLYCYVVEYKVDSTGIKVGTPYGTKVDRLEQHPLGNRITGGFVDNTFITVYEPYLDSSNRKVNVKIGVISDNNVLLSIKNGERNCLEKLMNYAKSAKSIYNTTLPIGNSKSIVQDIPLIHNQCYYVYFELENTEGKYYPVEDISIYQAIVTEEGKKTLTDNITWYIENGTTGTTDTDTTKVSSNKKTTDSTTAQKRIINAGYTSIIFAIIVVSIICFVLESKNRKYRGI